jgi:predicted metal-dependent phosphoesterase TrpH
MDATPESLVDFHTHSHYSDGVLSPAALVERARTRRVGTLALTDHDTTAGLAEARAACAASQIHFVPGVELSAQWRGQTIHIVGLQVDESHAGFNSHLDAVLQRRQERLREIGERLDTQEAFDRWLNRDKAGHVPAEWPDLVAAMAVLRDSGAIAVLAHPHRYRLSAGQLRELTAAFALEGGAALEASMAGMSPNDADRIASLCRRFKLRASMGSDFHDPAVPWNPLGRWLKLASRLEPVTNCLTEHAR